LQRFDTVEIKAVKTAEGFIEDSPIIGRVGILKYTNADGSVRNEFRPPEEAFKPESLATIRGKPVTVGHPGLVSAKNVTKVKPIGTVLTEGKQDGDNIRADVVIYNLDTKGRELSCGYNVDLDETPGIYNGMPYDAVQRNIRYNHLAVVPRGRAGDMARLNMDGEQSIEDTKQDEGEPRKMAKLKLKNGIDYEVPAEVAAEFDSMSKDAKCNTDKITKMESAAVEKDAENAKKMDALEAERDGLKDEKAKFDEQLKAKDKEHADSIDKLVKGRVSLLSVASTHKVEKADEMTDKDIKLAVIKVVRGDSADLTEKSDAYIDAAFDFCKEDTIRNDSMAEQRKTVNNKKTKENRQDEKEMTSQERRDAMAERLKNAYKEETK
jgi:hypothetical protein